jgi:alpha-amylase/alpha-mannosidase (GH57 family)
MKDKLKVVLCWHMHQPQYKDQLSGEYLLPWTYLHATKDYTDMAAHLEAIDGAKAVVNFAPVLLDQIHDYARQVRRFLQQGSTIHDELLSVLAGDKPVPLSTHARRSLIEACTRANGEHMIAPFEPFQQLVDLVALWQQQTDVAWAYLDESFITDLLVWYHLVWLGNSVHRNDQRVELLLSKGRFFTLQDRLTLLTVIAELLEGVIPRYAALEKAGKVELSMSPYDHPIIPLLIDFQSATEAMPDAPLPQQRYYPGGHERAVYHLQEGIRCFKKYFGHKPRGVWLSEGGVSEAALGVLDEYHFRWTASGEAVWNHSQLALTDKPRKKAVEDNIHHIYRQNDHRVACFFRNDGLSDLIGFTYAKWHADDAVGDFLQHLENIRQACTDHDNACVSIILDGENAWEYYPHNGRYFLEGLYQALADAPGIELTTFSEALKTSKPRTLPHLVAGSWVYGTFSTWIGEPAKNRAWDLLCDAKQIYDRVVASGRLNQKQQQQASEQLAICEGSDWFWWFGDYNPVDSVQDFDQLYRLHLRNLYRFLGETPPESLSQVISRGGGDPQNGGVMRGNS